MNMDNALKQLANYPEDTIVLAGGTDLMVNPHASGLLKKKIIDLSKFIDLKGIQLRNECLEIGSLTTFSQIRRDPLIQKYFPMLTKAASVTGALAIQNRGTIGGNVANASPAADTPPVLLAYDAEIALLSARGSRIVPYWQFHTGYKKTLMAKDEVIEKFILPLRSDGFIDYFEKVGAREAQAISKVGIAATGRREGRVISDIRLAFSSVAPTVLRCVKTERFLKGSTCDAALIKKACLILSEEISPIDDIRSNAFYRRKVAINLVEYFLKLIAK